MNVSTTNWGSLKREKPYFYVNSEKVYVTGMHSIFTKDYDHLKKKYIRPGFESDVIWLSLILFGK